MTADPEAQGQETALHQAYYSNANPNNRERHSKLTKNAIKRQRHANYYATCS